MASPWSQLKDGWRCRDGEGEAHDYFLPHWALGTGVVGRLHHRNGKNGEKKEERRARDGRDAPEIKGGVQPTLPLPISPVPCIEYPCTKLQGSKSFSLYLSSFGLHSTYFPFQALQKRMEAHIGDSDDGIFL